jgi:HEAT repeat protein
MVTAKSFCILLVLQMTLFAAWPVRDMTPNGETSSTISNKEIRIEELAKKLGQRDWQKNADTLVEVGELAIEPLIRILKSKSTKPWIIQARIVGVLGRIGTPSAVQAIVESLRDRDSNSYVRGYAATALAELKIMPAVEVLVSTLQDESQFVRWRSAQALGILGGKEGANALVLTLKDKDEYVRAAAAKSLGQIKAEDSQDNLVAALTDEHWLVRLNTRDALLEMGALAVPHLIKALNDKDPQTRWQAAWVLGRIKPEEAIQPLIEAIEDTDWMVRDEAAVSLLRMDSEKAAGLLVKAVQDGRSLISRQAEWILSKMKSSKSVKSEQNNDTPSQAPRIEQIEYNQEVYRCYPDTLAKKPDIPSPYKTIDGAEIVLACMRNGDYVLIPVTVENGAPLNYKQRQWGKGRQLHVDAEDFPTLAKTGLHSNAELGQTKMITGRSTVEITELGRPGRSSGAGFMCHDEDVVSVLKGDDHTVRELGLTHPQLAKPLFHVWNMMLVDFELGRLARSWDHIGYMLYNGKKVSLKGQGTRGWQESLFEDEILGMYQFEMWRELSPEEEAFLRKKYSHLDDEQMTEFFKALSHIHTGEMVPYYIMRYGFYEGHTDYRADPIAVAWIFGLKSLEQIEAAFEGNLYNILIQHFTKLHTVKN